MLSFQEINKLATQAYMDVWRQHRVGWSPPPGNMRDKKWSQMLYQMWPEYTPINVRTGTADSPNYREMRQWCDNQDTGYWVNGGGNRWYFERRDIAALFKLTFGGAQ